MTTRELYHKLKDFVNIPLSFRKLVTSYKKDSMFDV